MSQARLRLELRNFSSLTREELKELSGLTLPGMDSYYKAVLRYPERHQDNKVILGRDPVSRRIFAWSLLEFRHPGDRRVDFRGYFERECYDVTLYVSPTYRRTGVGSKIVAMARKVLAHTKKPINVYPHDLTSERFFRSVKLHQ